MYVLRHYIHRSRLGDPLVRLVNCPWQINGCAQCLDVHSNDARASGETEHLRAGRLGFGISQGIIAESSQNQIRMTGIVDTLKSER
jgi:hypothetical protein